MGSISQYDIVLVNLDPTVGSEMKKTRPCVVISPDEMNKYLRMFIVAPMTWSSKPYSTRVKLSHQGTSGWAVLDQVRTIDRTRIVRVYHRLSETEIAAVKSVIRELLVD